MAPIKVIDARASRNSIIVARIANFKMDQLLLYFYAMIITLTRVAYFRDALFAENCVLIKDNADA